jgi:1-acyl-sn-glycerol-3-phosphate acyltransferase
VPPLPVRRLLTPIVVVFEIFLLLVLALGALIGLVSALADRRRRLLRLALMGIAYICVELAALTVLVSVWMAKPFRSPGWYDDINRRILASTLGAVGTAARGLVGFRVVTQDPPSLAPLDGDEPVLILARHGGIGDSFALVWLLVGVYHRRPRVVLKEVLLWEPLIDVALTRMGACFLSSRSKGGIEQIRKVGLLASGLAPEDALLLFPEGANWTPRRWSRAVGRLRAGQKRRAAQTAELMENVLPPRPAGVLASLNVRPDIAVVVFAHSGLDKITTAGKLWKAIPFRRPMTARWWPTAPPPLGRAGRLEWLTTEWAVVDEWIAGQAPPPS